MRDYLQQQSERRVHLSFVEIEQRIGPLPSSARKHRAWWANDKSGRHVHARSWLDAGWRTAKVDLNAATADFVKEEAADFVASQPR